MITLDKRSKEPLYLQVKAGIRAQIDGGAFPPGQPLPSEAEFARQLGLSSLTVRRSILELTQEGRLRRIPGRGTFVIPGDDAAVRSISLVLPHDVNYDLSSPFLLHLMRGIYGAAQPAPLVLRDVPGDAAALAGSQGSIALWLLDPTELARLAATAPVVGYECAADPAAPAFDNIGHANEAGAYAATSALISLGHTDIACAVQDTSSGNVRRAGFERALRQYAVPPRAERILPVVNTSEAGYAFGRRLLADPATAPTALLCTDDTIAYGVLAAAQELGRSVPEFISIVGFGDLGQFTTPALSSVRMDIEASGRMAVQMLRERATNPAMPPSSVVLPTEFIRRASCGPPRPPG